MPMSQGNRGERQEEDRPVSQVEAHWTAVTATTRQESIRSSPLGRTCKLLHNAGEGKVQQELLVFWHRSSLMPIMLSAL